MNKTALGWVLTTGMAVAAMGAMPAAAADLRFFKTTKLQYRSTQYSWGWQTVLRSEGEFYAQACGAFGNLEGAEAIFDADGTVYSGRLTHTNDSWYGVHYQDSTHDYKILVSGDKGIWKFDYTGRDRNVMSPPDVDLTLVVAGQGGSESLTLVADASVANQWVLEPEASLMTCFGADSFKFQQNWNSWGHTLGYVYVSGRYLTSDCDQLWQRPLNHGYVMLVLDHTVLSVAATNLTRSGDWYAYRYANAAGNWEIHINPHTGQFWAKVYNADMNLVDPIDGIDVTLLVDDQIGFQDFIVVGGATDAYHNAWSYMAASPACSTL